MGEQVAEYAGGIFAMGRELMEMVKGQPVGRPLDFRVGVRDVMSKLVAFRLLQPALELEQPVRLVCQEGDMVQLISALAIHKLDVVLSDTALDPLYKVQAYSHRLGESDIVIVGTKALAAQYRKCFPSSLDALRSCCRLRTASCGDRWNVGSATEVSLQLCGASSLTVQ